MSMPSTPTWLDNQGNLLSCNEKIKVMQQNMEELFQVAQDAFEDGLLMGCDEQQLRGYLQTLMQGLENPY